MKSIKAVMMTAGLVALLGGWARVCSSMGEEKSKIKNQKSKIEGADINEISAYYGFGEMEIVKLDWGVQNLCIADFDGDSRNDIAVANNRKAKIELLIQKEAFGPDEPEVTVDPNDVDINTLVGPTRFKRQNVAVSQRMYSLVCGDLNSDGLTDLAFYGEPRGLYVVLQKSGKAEERKAKSLSWHTRKKITIDDGILSAKGLACADLNGDGADDLVCASNDGVYIILQRKDGSLAEAVKYASAARPVSVAVGDLNGDSRNDLVLVTEGDEKPVHVRFGLASKELGPHVHFFIEKPLAFELANVDGIVGDEILTVDAVSKRLICYKFAAQEGDEADWPILFYPLAHGEGSGQRDLAVGDFDGDGLTDVVISDPGAAELMFYRQVARQGLAEAVRFPAFSDIESVSAAEMGGDGKTDLGVLSVKEKAIGISMYENNRLSFPKPIALSGEPLAMELSDVDGDGDVDCVYVAKAEGGSRYFEVAYSVGRAEGNEGAEPNKNGGAAESRVELSKLASNPAALRVIDVDQDGMKDVIIFVKYESPILIRQSEPRRFEFFDSPRAQSSLIKEASARSIATADVDGQPGEELLVAQGNFARSLILLNGRKWSVIDQYNAKNTENKVSAVGVFDIDSSGPGSTAEILLLDGQKGQLQILRAAEDKTYRFDKEVNVGRWSAASGVKMLYESLTGGVAKSILLFDAEKFALITPPRRGSVQEHPELQFNYETKIKEGRYGNLTAGDINSDGLVDIIMVEYKRNHIEILALAGEGQVTPAMRFKVFEQKSYRDSSRQSGQRTIEPRELKVSDVTGDGRDDLIIMVHDRIIIYPQD